MKNTMRLTGILLPMAVMLSLFIGFFERPVVFHDEIINASKAQDPVVFDYAARPVFYFLNYLGTSFFGDHPLALSFVLTLFALAGGWLSFLFAKRYYGYAAGVAAVSTYCWLGWVYAIGISAMAHLLPAVFTLLAIYLYTPLKVELIDWRGRVGFSILLWMALLSHPTGVAYFLPFFAFLGFDLARAYLDKRATLGDVLRQGGSWVVISIVVWVGVEVGYKLFSEKDISYAGSWLAGLDKTSDDTYSKYFQPYGYYFQLFAQRFWLVLAAAVAAAFLLAISFFSGHKTSPTPDDAGSDGRVAIRLLVFAVLSLCVVSTQSWKFERVAVTFAPIATLALVCLIFFMLGRIQWRTTLLKSLFAAAIVVGSGYSFAKEVDRVSGDLVKRRATYSSFMEAIRGAEVDRVAYVGARSGIRLAEMPTAASGRSLHPFGPLPRNAAEAEALVSNLKKQGHGHVLVEVGEDARKAYPLRNYLYESRMQRVASYRRGNYELWTLNAFELDAPGDGLADVKAGIAKRLDVYLRYDRVASRKQGNERQVYFEVLGEDLEQTEDAVVEAIESSGYPVRKGLRDTNGIRIGFPVPGAASVNVLIRDKQSSPSFQRPQATASVYLRQVVD